MRNFFFHFFFILASPYRSLIIFYFYQISPALLSGSQKKKHETVPRDFHVSFIREVYGKTTPVHRVLDSFRGDPIPRPRTGNELRELITGFRFLFFSFFLSFFLSFFFCSSFYCRYRSALHTDNGVDKLDPRLGASNAGELTEFHSANGLRHYETKKKETRNSTIKINSIQVLRLIVVDRPV